MPKRDLETGRPVPAREALMVATSVGPGASAPVRPMRKPSASVERISVGNVLAPFAERRYVVVG